MSIIARLLAHAVKVFKVSIGRSRTLATP